MLGRLLLSYAVVELMVTIGLAAAIGVGWTVAVLTAAFVLGLVVGAPMGGLQLSRQLGQLRRGVDEPRSALGDGALTTLATGLVIIPGLATTTLGLVLLVPPIRAAARPGLTALAVRGFRHRVPLTAFQLGDTPAGGDYIDGEVIDVREEGDAQHPPLPRPPQTRRPT